LLIFLGKPDLPSPLLPTEKVSSLARFAGPKDDLYTAINKPLKKKPVAVKGTATTSYTKLSELNVNNNPAVDNDKAANTSGQQSYSEVSFDQRPELEPAERRDSAIDDDMWVTVKWRQQQEKLQQQHSELERSIEEDPEALALSLLGGGDSHHKEEIPLQDYSNLADINTGQAFVGEVKRQEEDSNKIYIEGNTLGINSDNNLSIATHDYVNQDTDDGKEEQQSKQQTSTTTKRDVYSEVDDVSELYRMLDEKKKQQNGPVMSTPAMSDYVNTSLTPPLKVLYGGAAIILYPIGTTC